MNDSISALTDALADRYRVERELGQGGMATVYLAEDLKHARRVAVKVLHPDLAAALGAERFLSEIRTTANLQHPHILALHDSGVASGFLYYVMPYVEGESLRGRLEREKQLPIDDALRIARELADALGYAHARGVIHRDIKPENILLQGGHALVADFGIALAVQTAGGQRLTQTGLSLGTPHYMSPEQAMGERAIDARSDVYALGAVTYEMLTGEPPFTGATVQAIVAKVMTERPTRPSAVRDTIPEAVDDAVLRALAKIPADRFGTAAEFATALAGGAAGSGARRLTTGRHADGATTSTRAAHLWPAVAVIAVVAALWGWLRPQAPAAESPPSRLAVPIPMLGGASTSLQRQIALTPDGSTLFYTAITPDGENRTFRQALADTASVAVPGGRAVPRGLCDLARGGTGMKAMMTAATVSTAPRLAIASRKALFPVAEYSTATPHTNYGVSPDGKTFALVGFNQASRVAIIQNLPGLVRRLQEPAR